MNDASQTARSFRDKWHHNPNLAFAETLRNGSEIQNWILGRNGFLSTSDFAEWLAPKRRILDAGCGNGRVTALLRVHAPPDAEVVGIDLTAAEVARQNLQRFSPVTIVERDLLGTLDDLGTFDLIYCQEVLHHTTDPAAAFANLVRRLSTDGEIAIYVYRQKAPLREHADDYVRERVAGLSYDDAVLAMRQITELGKALTELNARVTVGRVDVLGIEPGEYEVQRLLYHYFLKCFWNPALDFGENVAINYDWYHPELCSRHTLPEVEDWFVSQSLTILHRHVDPYGITVRGRRR